MRLSAAIPAGMTGGAITKELEKLRKMFSAVCDELIAAGRGDELPSQTWKLNDPISEKYKAISNRQSRLRNEAERRYGPGYRVGAKLCGPLSDAWAHQ